MKRPLLMRPLLPPGNVSLIRYAFVSYWEYRFPMRRLGRHDPD